MNVECFLDTNVFVYAAAGRGDDESKRKRALELIETRDFGLSTQVLQEFYVVVTRKIEAKLSALQALNWIEELETFPCLAVDRSLVKIAAEMSEAYRISYWDAAILAAAGSMGAATVYSEDLASEQLYGSVRVLNPF